MNDAVAVFICSTLLGRIQDFEIEGVQKIMCVQRALTLLFATFANLHVRKLAMFADLHSYTHTYCSFILLNEAITICCFCFAQCTCVINLAFGFFSIQFTGKNIQQVENSTSKMAPPIPVCPK